MIVFTSDRDLHDGWVIIETDDEDDGCSFCVAQNDRPGEGVDATHWAHVSAAQAVELAEAILGRWGDSRDGLR